MEKIDLYENVFLENINLDYKEMINMNVEC